MISLPFCPSDHTPSNDSRFENLGIWRQNALRPDQIQRESWPFSFNHYCFRVLGAYLPR
jgi:hypothetical protein